MNIILLSGGSGKRLWPLSSDTRSKQYLKLLKTADGKYESMVERITRQIHESGITAHITIATTPSQYDSITHQFGGSVNIVTEPARRGTFPAIALSSIYLLKEQGHNPEDVVVVMPSDSYVDVDYFSALDKMANIAAEGAVDLVLLGVTPTQASTKFGYILPNHCEDANELITVSRFVEKPDINYANDLIAAGALWNGGAFAFKLCYIEQILKRYVDYESFSELRSRYDELKSTSFDYEVAERALSVGVVPYTGEWSDLGTWDSLTEKLSNQTKGNVIVSDDSNNSHVINELDIPILCLGLQDMIVASSPDGILVSSKLASKDVKTYADNLHARPMYEERRWGTYKVMGHEHFADGHNALTKLLHLKAGCNISYQYHNHREEIWTFIHGEGLLVIDDHTTKVSRGHVVHIKAGQRHAVKALTNLQIIEVQTGSELIEEDIIRLTENPFE